MALLSFFKLFMPGRDALWLSFVFVSWHTHRYRLCLCVCECVRVFVFVCAFCRFSEITYISIHKHISIHTHASFQILIEHMSVCVCLYVVGCLLCGLPTLWYASCTCMLCLAMFSTSNWWWMSLFVCVCVCLCVRLCVCVCVCDSSYAMSTGHIVSVSLLRAPTGDPHGAWCGYQGGRGSSPRIKSKHWKG